MSEIVVTAESTLVARRKTPLGETEESALLTAAQVREKLRCGLRQLYRYIKGGRLRPEGKFMGRWVFLERDVSAFHRPRRGNGARLPSFLKPVFWSYSLASLDPARHARYVVGQILEHGDLKAVRWACGYYGLDFILAAARGCRDLSPAGRNFWRLLGHAHS
ncbi:MAG: helix-turn-helix domain-containing protein [Elusimicrobia bacterium]|nr:helix-turn-helix domain-containing protein [Elusimicrobiota bacterium]